MTAAKSFLRATIALALLPVLGCATAPKATPTVASTEEAASTASQPEIPKPEGASGGGSSGGGTDSSESSGGDGSATTADEQGSPSDADPSAGKAGTAATGVKPAGPATADERAAELDRDLDESLAEFDGMLAREQQVLEEKRAEEAASEPSGGGYAAGPTGSTSGSSAPGESGGERPTRSGGGEAGSSMPEGEPEEIDEEMASRVPPDVGDGSDDDVVARQLREAAMKEEDPELREKLWDEYRKYKGSADH